MDGLFGAADDGDAALLAFVHGFGEGGNELADAGEEGAGAGHFAGSMGS